MMKRHVVFALLLISPLIFVPLADGGYFGQVLTDLPYDVVVRGDKFVSVTVFHISSRGRYEVGAFFVLDPTVGATPGGARRTLTIPRGTARVIISADTEPASSSATIFIHQGTDFSPLTFTSHEEIVFDPQ
jgi:hypothetical protein